MAMFVMLCLGVFVYVSPILGYFFVEQIHQMITQALKLAFELTAAMMALYLYPFGIFMNHIYNRNFSLKAKNTLTLQSQVASSVVVSLGLIGTFQGLTMMVTEISRSVGGDAPAILAMVGSKSIWDAIWVTRPLLIFPGA